jgi:hypothetical protein
MNQVPKPLTLNSLLLIQLPNPLCIHGPSQLECIGTSRGVPSEDEAGRFALAVGSSYKKQNLCRWTKSAKFWRVPCLDQYSKKV